MVCLRFRCIIFCLLLNTHSGNTGILFSLLSCSLWWVQIIRYALACISYLFVCTLHHLMWVRLRILSQLSIIHYMGLCVLSLPISRVMTEIIYIYIYTLSYYPHQIGSGSMNYYPLFLVRSRNNGMRVCLSMFLFFWMGLKWDEYWKCTYKLHHLGSTLSVFFLQKAHGTKTHIAVIYAQNCIIKVPIFLLIFIFGMQWNTFHLKIIYVSVICHPCSWNLGMEE